MDITTRKILVVDDTAFMLAVISKTLIEHNYTVVTASSGEQALEILKKEKPDLILLDGIMTGISGYVVLEQLRNDFRYNLTPIIMLTGQSDDEDKLKGLEMGADDYIVKPFNSRELVARVNNTLVRLERNRGANPLTGLRGNNDIEMEIAKRIELENPFSVLYLDLNSFKPYNDVYGFGNGDIAIKMTADVISETVVDIGSPDDFVGHIGGDDFVVLTTPELAETISEIIINKFDTNVLELYTPEDVEKGFITATDRMGNINQFALIGISVAIVYSDRHNITGTLQLAEVAAVLKKKAKSKANGKSAYAY